jgi:hypothetical protein
LNPFFDEKYAEPNRALVLDLLFQKAWHPPLVLGWSMSPMTSLGQLFE